MQYKLYYGIRLNLYETTPNLDNGTSGHSTEILYCGAKQHIYCNNALFGKYLNNYNVDRLFFIKG
jgi:hypothetical protein